jgi:hypothetical protein
MLNSHDNGTKLRNSDVAIELPKLLLLTVTTPGESCVGRLFLRDLCQEYPSDRLAFGVVSTGCDALVRQLFPMVPMEHLQYDESLSRQSGTRWVSLIRRHAVFQARSFFSDRRLVTELVAFAKDVKVDKVWAILESPLMYRLAVQVSRRLDIPLVSTIWDPPDGVGYNFGLDRLSRRIARADFETAVRTSERCGVISERMQEEYQRKYDVPTVILRHGISPADQAQPQFENDTSELRIGFCGSLYAKEEWRALMKGLEGLAWHVGSRSVRVIVVGRQLPETSSASPSRLDFLGWRPVREVISRISECHFSYLPYWFHPAYAESVRLCFPTKLTTYLTAGRPVLYHGPYEAAVVDFFHRYDIGHCCHTLKANAVGETIIRFAELVETRSAEMHDGIRQAVRDELNLDVFRSRFVELVTGRSQRRALESSVNNKDGSMSELGKSSLLRI